jgi:hypothetical protein
VLAVSIPAAKFDSILAKFRSSPLKLKADWLEENLGGHRFAA